MVLTTLVLVELARIETQIMIKFIFNLLTRKKKSNLGSHDEMRSKTRFKNSK